MRKEDIISPDLFGNEAGEDESEEILNSYFVDKPEFNLFYSKANRFQIVRSRKGVGKSALLKKTQYQLQNDPNIIAVYVKGSDLAALEPFDTMTPHELISGWQKRICTKITIEIGRRLNLAFDDDSISLVESAEVTGFRGRNLVGSLADRLKLKLGKIDIDIKKILSDNAQALLERYSKDKDINVWLLVDDIDATFLNTEEQRLYTSTFFSACRNIINLVNGLTIRASVRTDVWTIIDQYDEALDKCGQYIIDLSWSTTETGKILKKKILSFYQRKYPNNFKYKNISLDSPEERIFELVFIIPFPWGRGRVAPFRPIHILSAGRPRWAAQLCKLAAKHAFSNNFGKISIRNIDRVLEIYGRSRLNDLYKEHTHQCKNLKDLIEAFAGGPKKYTTQDMLKRITDKIIKLCGLPKIDGEEKGKDSIYIAHFLFRIGFICARDENDDTGLAFIKHEDRPHLLTSKVNLDDGLWWEIHPSYRKILRIKY
ncbi:hypothetical protein DENIS_4077 [Desulfonema ishimotonii]|uniref:Uncharacterized protein n=1 Tax=Desulfonema ishimotonii TaxID=45657 RepID=A0A401G1H3_9BACT|nr:hypothetical protein [Desulfonema ishimotonii]GBC63088.1 hypothetical protein DENIS_4077 [Desulfonema ishimotonii]